MVPARTLAISNIRRKSKEEDPKKKSSKNREQNPK
jgi:hypothetical protein